MRVFLKKQSIQLDGSPAKLLKEIESTKERIRQLEAGERITEEKYQQFAGESSWLRKELASGNIVLRDVVKIDSADNDAKLCQASLKRIQRDLAKAKTDLTRMIASFNASWVSVEVGKEIR